MNETPLKMYRRSELQAVDDGCLHRFKAIWIDGVSDTSDPAHIGIGFHKIKHRYILRLVAAGVPNDMEEAQAAFQEGVVAANTPSRLIPQLRLLWDWHAEKFELPIDQFLTAEERQTQDNITWAPDLVLVKAAINELDTHDDKSGWAPPPTEDELRGLFQARVYSAYARMKWPGFKTYRFTLNAVRYNRSTSVVFSNGELDLVERELQAHIDTIEAAHEANAWPAVAGPACRFCELDCPIETTALVPKRLLTPTIRHKFAAMALAMEQQLKVVKKTLKADVAANGPIDVNGVVWADRPVTERKYPIGVVLEAMKARNSFGAFDELTLSHSALSGLFRQFPELEAALASSAQVKNTYRFGAKKAGYDETGGSDES